MKKPLYYLCRKALIIGHTDQDMIVSGSFFSLTQQLPVLAIKTPFLDGFNLNQK
jgi:hypothetical protein